jgi:hypothetical protein
MRSAELASIGDDFGGSDATIRVGKAAPAA